VFEFPAGSGILFATASRLYPGHAKASTRWYLGDQSVKLTTTLPGAKFSAKYLRFSGHHCNQVISSIVSHVLCDPAVSCLVLHVIRSMTGLIQFSSALSMYCRYIQKPSNYGSPPCCSFNVNPETGTFCHPLWICHAYFVILCC
jgi:hypothetical protein